MSEDEAFEDPKPLGIKCTSSDCENGLHCFRQTLKMRRENTRGVCRDCGADLVDWSRVYRQDLGDVAHTFEALNHELIRHHFWHVALDQHAINYALRKGRKGIRETALNRIKKSVGAPRHPLEGRQTPFEGNPIYYAQHAVAACCRACIEEWHDIPRDQELSEEEIQYLTELVILYVFDRFPELPENGQKVPAIKRESQTKPKAA